MGQEIETTSFTDADSREFAEHLREETDLLMAWEKEGRISGSPRTAGFELECWLVDRNMQPVARNEEFIAALDNDLVVPELSRFNLEFNGDPEILSGTGISDLHRNLEDLWRQARDTAAELDLRLAMIGILPTVTSKHLCEENMSDGRRYKAINNQIFRLRKGQPITLDIDGVEHLQSKHMDVMLEAGATSFQIHLKIPEGGGTDYYNASKLASAPLMAVSANSPYLFGRDLWAESRIPLFEQAVSVGKWDYAERVTFGVRFIEEGFGDIFCANRQRYPVLLPQCSDRPPEKMDHLRLQNGTIWRWNRPIVGWDEDGTPHFRMEQRVVPAGPTIIDSMANAAFYYGLVTGFAENDIRPHQQCQYHTARDNFYLAAHDGLDARIRWEQIDDRPIDELICDLFLPMAHAGLEQLDIAKADRELYLGIIEQRARTGQTGAVWQRRFVKEHGGDMAKLLESYLHYQDLGEPVHSWPLVVSE